MTKMEYLEQICIDLGVDVSTLPDRTMTTYLSAISEKLGVMKTNGTLGEYLALFSKEFAGGGGGADSEELRQNFINVIQGGDEVVLPEGLTEIRPYMFSEHPLVKVTFPSTLTFIHEYAFAYCVNLEELIIPDSVIDIYENTFQDCEALQRVKMPKDLGYIDFCLFDGCSSCVEYDFSSHTAVPKMISRTAFDGINDDAVIKVPSALLTEWKAATNWVIYADYIVGV